MRNSTKHKLFGRTQLVQAIRATILDLDTAQHALEQRQINTTMAFLQESIKRLDYAAQAMDIYRVERKRILTALHRAKEELEIAVTLAKAIPVTQVEKTEAKRKRDKS